MKFAVVLSLIAGINGAGLRESVQGSLEQEVHANDPVCNEILNSWWNQRHSAIDLMTSSVASPTNDVCNLFSGDWEACTVVKSDARTAAVAANAVGISNAGLTTQQAKDVRCASLGANSKTCIQNNCNYLNEGSCTIQDTGGLCYWFPQSVQGQPGVPGFGCFRNPCNLGNAPHNDKNGCAAATVPDIVECTWCKVSGEGMGCQATTATTTAECANINSNIPARASIYQEISNHLCQCTMENNMCEDILTSRSGQFEPRF